MDTEPLRKLSLTLDGVEFSLYHGGNTDPIGVIEARQPKTTKDVQRLLEDHIIECARNHKPSLPVYDAGGFLAFAAFGSEEYPTEFFGVDSPFLRRLATAFDPKHKPATVVAVTTDGTWEGYPYYQQDSEHYGFLAFLGKHRESTIFDCTSGNGAVTIVTTAARLLRREAGQWFSPAMQALPDNPIAKAMNDLDPVREIFYPSADPEMAGYALRAYLQSIGVQSDTPPPLTDAQRLRRLAWMPWDARQSTHGRLWRFLLSDYRTDPDVRELTAPSYDPTPPDAIACYLEQIEGAVGNTDVATLYASLLSAQRRGPDTELSVEDVERYVTPALKGAFFEECGEDAHGALLWGRWVVEKYLAAAGIGNHGTGLISLGPTVGAQALMMTLRAAVESANLNAQALHEAVMQVYLFLRTDALAGSAEWLDLSGVAFPCRATDVADLLLSVGDRAQNLALIEHIRLGDVPDLGFKDFLAACLVLGSGYELSRAIAIVEDFRESLGLDRTRDRAPAPSEQSAVPASSPTPAPEIPEVKVTSRVPEIVQGALASTLVDEVAAPLWDALTADFPRALASVVQRVTSSAFGKAGATALVALGIRELLPVLPRKWRITTMKYSAALEHEAHATALRPVVKALMKPVLAVAKKATTE